MSVLWERLPSKRVTVGPYSPLTISNSRRVPAVISRHVQSSPVICSSHPSLTVLANYLQGPPVTCRAHPSRESSGELRHLRHLQSPPVLLGQSSGRTLSYPSVPGTLSSTAVTPALTEDGWTGRLGPPISPRHHLKAQCRSNLALLQHTLLMHNPLHALPNPHTQVFFPTILLSLQASGLKSACQEGG